ncbi:MAG: type II toxin-antitoxin system VapC family toxin [Acetobacteraceae bacterium]
MSDGTVVLDASALLALLQSEPGAEVVADLLSVGVMSAVNLSEVVAKLIDHGMPLDQAREALDELPIQVHPFDRDAAFAAAELRRVTRSAGLSLGDRACLALAAHLGVAAVTSDGAWATLADGVARITLVR